MHHRSGVTATGFARVLNMHTDVDFGLLCDVPASPTSVVRWSRFIGILVKDDRIWFTAFCAFFPTKLVPVVKFYSL